MALFLKQTDQRSALQSKVAADLASRIQPSQGGTGVVQEGATMQPEEQAATGKSLFWVGVITMAVVALVVFMLFVSEAV
jgi:hypothetical protein